MKKNLIIWAVAVIALISIGVVISLSGVVNKKGSTVNNSPATNDGQALVNEAANNSVNDNVASNSSETAVEPVATDNTGSKIIGDTTAGKAPSSAAAQIANPASTNCTKVGGNLVTKARGDGGAYSICRFDDGSACEEWALMRGDCKSGDVTTITESSTIDQKYCIWAGGQASAGKNSICTLKNGSKCSTLDLFNGVCPK